MYYLDQPINEFTCNPFFFGVRLDCTAYHRSNKDYDIHWYKIPLGVEKADPELVNSYRLYKHTNNVDNYFGGKLIKSQFLIRSPTDSHNGVYWCQVVMLDESGHASSNGSFKASSPFLLYSSDKYSSFPPCSDVYQSQPRSTCARIGEQTLTPSQPPATSDRASTSPDQIVTFGFGQSSVTTDPNSNDLPPWGYAVIAGGGVASMLIITVIICILLVYCQTLQKYKASKFSRENSYLYFPHTLHVWLQCMGSKSKGLTWSQNLGFTNPTALSRDHNWPFVSLNIQ